MATKEKSVPSENTIRDKLVATLDVLEPGLTLVERNHALPNAVGAKGFIDILARDRLGTFVIIELKRSDQSSREALFEILKYIPLFIRLHGVQPHRIRCFIVSTNWHELLVPYSEFRRRCEAQTEGFRIEVDANGRVTKAEKVADHIEDDLAQSFRLHCCYLYPTAAERNDSIASLRAAYQDSGTTGFVLFRLDYRGSSPHVTFPFAAYFVVTRADPSVLAGIKSEAENELGAEDGKPDDVELRYSTEDRFLGRVNESLSDHFGSHNLEVSPSTPDNFANMVEGTWRIVLIERFGPHSSTLIMPDSDLIEMVKGASGDNSVRFERITSPSNKLDWNYVLASAATFLQGNPIWQAGTTWFFDRVEQEFASGTVLIQIYNPLMLPESLYRFATTGSSEYIPLLAVTSISADASYTEAIVGTIVWDGKMFPTSVRETFLRLSEGVDNVADYYLSKTIGVAWTLDEELVRRHGLQYSLCFLKYINEENKEATRLVVSGNNIGEQPDPLLPESISEYFDAARTYLEELVTHIDEHVIRVT